MPITDQKTSKYHPTERNKVLASADVRIRQVQVVDKKGQIRSVIVWQCGPDVFYANNMDGLFDIAQRRKAPEWLLEALAALPTDKQFSYEGKVKVTPDANAADGANYLPTSDSDVPDFVQG